MCGCEQSKDTRAPKLSLQPQRQRRSLIFSGNVVLFFLLFTIVSAALKKNLARCKSVWDSYNVLHLFGVTNSAHTVYFNSKLHLTVALMQVYLVHVCVVKA